MRKQSFYIFGGVVLIALALIYFYGVNRNGVQPYEGFSNGNSKLSMYYVDWCPHCTNAKPDFESMKAGGPLQVNGKSVDINMVNPEKTPEAAAGKPVKGYPTILLEKMTGEIVEYTGERNKEGYMAFLKENI